MSNVHKGGMEKTAEQAWLQGTSPTFFCEIFDLSCKFSLAKMINTNFIQNTDRNLTSVNTFSIYGTYFIVQQKMHTLCHLGR